MASVSRRSWLKGAALSLGSLSMPRALAQGSQSANIEPPNIVYIMADDLGYGDLGCYGQEVIQTPNIDKLAEEGLRFTQCYAGSTVCAPSRCSLMTGLHTGHCRIRGNDRVPLEPEDVTVAEVLKEAGYTTAIIGKWGLGEPDTPGIPNRQGFDYWYGYLNQGRAHNYYPEYLWRNEEKVLQPGNKENPDEPQVSLTRETYSHDVFTQEALAYLERVKNDRFFLYLPYTIPHANNERGRVDGDGMEVPSYEPYTDKDWPDQEKGRAAMITRMDRDIGQIMAKLKELGLDGNTLVFFTSDNGSHREGGSNPEFFHSSGPLRGIKRDLYDGGIRVPMIARWPGMIEPGVSEHVWAFWDFLPTAADLANVAPPEDIDGLSVAPVLLGDMNANEGPFADRFLYWEFHERGFKQAARWRHWKAVRLPNIAELELYNVKDDLGETTNVAELHPAVVEVFEEYFQTARTQSGHWPGLDA